MNNSVLKNISTGIFGVTAIALGSISAAPAQATTLTGFSTCGGDMAGMLVTVGFLDGTSQTATWVVQNSKPCYYNNQGHGRGQLGGGASGNGWSITESGDTYGAYYDYGYSTPWTFNYSGGSPVKSLVLNAIPGNALFDRYTGIEYTPGSADGWDFDLVSGPRPDSVSYLVPPAINDYQNDLFGTLSLAWNNGFQGTLKFLVDTDSGTTSDPVKPRDPQPAPSPAPSPSPAPPPNTPPPLTFSDYTIDEGQAPSVTLYATDPDPNPITFTLNGQTITDQKTSGTRSATFNLGTYADNGSISLAGIADDGRNGTSALNKTLTVLNVAPTLTSFALNGNDSNITINEGQSVSAALSAIDPGLYDDITFLVNDSNKGTDTTDTTGARNISYNVGTFNKYGTYTYTAKAYDKDQAVSNTLTRTVTVNNVPPTLTAFNLSSDTIDEGQSAFANLSATDPGADAITFLLNGKSVGTDSTLSGTRSLGTNLGLFNIPGTYTFNAQAQDDGAALSNIIQKTLTVKDVPPTITSLTGPLQVPSGSIFDFAATATDPGNIPLTYSWDFSGNSLFNDFTGQSGKWSFGRDGLYDVALRVSDGYGGFAYRRFQIESVPEPSSTLGMLALGAMGVGSLLKRKQQQKA